MKSLTNFFLLLCMLFIGACKEDYVYPDVLTEFTELKTDKEGIPASLLTDRDESFTIQEVPETYKLKSDTVYRAVTMYQLLEENSSKVRMYNALSVFSPIPVSAEKFGQEIKMDPVDIRSMWITSRYLNFILNIQAKEKPHSYHFIDQGIHNNTDGSRTLLFTFHHDRKDDYEAFTRKVYFSIPLRHYEGKLQKGDKIQLRINTYKEGEVIREFNY